MTQHSRQTEDDVMRVLEQLAEPFADEEGFEQVAKAADEEYHEAIDLDLPVELAEYYASRAA